MTEQAKKTALLRLQIVPSIDEESYFVVNGDKSSVWFSEGLEDSVLFCGSLTKCLSYVRSRMLSFRLKTKYDAPKAKNEQKEAIKSK